MIKQSFNRDWIAGPKQNAFASFSGAAPDTRPVTLPYDALRDQPRSADSGQGSHTAYYPGGLFEYTKTFDVPAEWRDKTVIVEFEGVYRDAMVYINGEFAAQRPNGYAGFAIKADPYLRYGAAEHASRSQARAHEDSRWYTGAGSTATRICIVGRPGARRARRRADHHAGRRRRARGRRDRDDGRERQPRHTRTVRVATRDHRRRRHGGRERLGAGDAAARHAATVARARLVRRVARAVEPSTRPPCTTCTRP